MLRNYLYLKDQYQEIINAIREEVGVDRGTWSKYIKDIERSPFKHLIGEGVLKKSI
jgi:hypothetical protein